MLFIDKALADLSDLKRELELDLPNGIHRMSKTRPRRVFCAYAATVHTPRPAILLTSPRRVVGRGRVRRRNTVRTPSSTPVGNTGSDANRTAPWWPLAIAKSGSKGPRRGPRTRTRGGTLALHGLGPYSSNGAPHESEASAL